MSDSPSTRINKYLSEVGYCSRRAADKLIAAGRVTLNGVVPEIGVKIGPGDRVCVDGRPVRPPEEARVYLAYNKPVGVVCTTDTTQPGNIVDAIDYPTRIFPIGRLDKPSQGLIFLTNDGDIVNKILRARNNHEKEYVVTVDRPISPRFLAAMGAGVPILDTVTAPCALRQRGKFVFEIVLTQGLNRQIRRMCSHLGYAVTKLERVRIMNVSLDLPVGRWRPLTAGELAQIERLVAGSAKTHD